MVALCAGHLCMRNKGLAKSSVNILVRELDTADDPAVRSNALVVLGDLCVRCVLLNILQCVCCVCDQYTLWR